jgi:hypothetical protein
MSDNEDDWNELLKKLKLHKATFANDADKQAEDNRIMEMEPVPLADIHITEALQTYVK